MATSAFGKAFRAARDAGDKEFTFNGKQYNTRLAEEDAGAMKEKRDAGMRKKSDMVVALGRASRSIGDETSDLAKAKIAQAKASAERDYATADMDETMKGYKPRYTQPGRAPKMTEGATYEPMPFKSMMPERDISDIGMKKGGNVASSASKRGDGSAQRGKTRGRLV